MQEIMFSQMIAESLAQQTDQHLWTPSKMNATN